MTLRLGVIATGEPTEGDDCLNCGRTTRVVPVKILTDTSVNDFGDVAVCVCNPPTEPGDGA